MNHSAAEIRQQFIDFFVKRVPEKLRHKQIPSASLIPENDPTVLFTTAGMHPLVPYLMGEPHPSGKRLVNAQKCLRTDDIDEVGDATHLTFFEMLGNWSLGDYFKEEAIKMSFELLTLPWEKGGYGLDVDRLSVSCFEGDKDASRDLDAAKVWESLGFTQAEKSVPGHKKLIYFFPKKKNWWGPAGKTGPCGPDTEMFYDVCPELPAENHNPNSILSAEKLPKTCDPSCDCGRYVEVWNDVFMQYYKKEDGSFEPLKQKNVDTGLGFERLVTILHGKDSPFETELFVDAINFLKEKSQLGFKVVNEEKKTSIEFFEESELAFKQIEWVKSSRVIVDHLRAATFILGDRFGVVPSNVDQGYILRRLIRRAIRHGRTMGIEGYFSEGIAEIFINIYGDIYRELEEKKTHILSTLHREEEQFSKTLGRGNRELEKMIHEKYPSSKGKIHGEDAFHLFDTYGFPPEMTAEEVRAYGMNGVDMVTFDEAFKKHQALSRVGAAQKFAGGLADHSEQCKMHHTATHLVHQALRDVLGTHVFQKGSNITKERLRFDFSHSIKMTPEEIKKVEDIVNAEIQNDLPIHFEILDVDEAKKQGAIGLFDDKYATLGNKVKVYVMGPPTGMQVRPFSMEVCGGPHVEHTGTLKHFKILKEEACSAGVRRIKAVVDGIKDVI